MDWSKIKYFTPDEFRCKYSHEVHMDESFVMAIDELRRRYGKPLRITSGFRHRTKHPIEARKRTVGAHTTGKACDIGVSRGDAHHLLHLACEMGCFTGIGIQQKGGGRFLHHGIATTRDLKGTWRPNIWSY